LLIWSCTACAALSIAVTPLSRMAFRPLYPATLLLLLLLRFSSLVEQRYYIVPLSPLY
jgi:hypothetical protein